ncbi:MAG: glycosyltransferase family 2 protein [Lachnospiraceae bacterium]|nr:glycosyltransferase family 2 protein [Lachnospiraceae bacterium]
MEPILYIVVPCYNEEEVLAETTKRLTAKLNAMIKGNVVSSESRIMYVNDGSKDRTWEIINDFYKSNEFVTGVNLSRNRGHQNALLAGLMTAKEYADIVISMDADLQDDIEVLDKFVEEYKNGSEIVYGVRSSRKKDTFFKKHTALAFYKIMEKMGVEIVYNHADYRLMSKRAIEELAGYKEVNLFLRGIIPMIGFKTSTVEYERDKRFAGESKYPLKKMIAFAIDGITSCSIKPIRLITTFGFLIFLISMLLLIYVVIGYFLGNTVAGWPTLMVLMCFFGGFQIMSIGVVGEYVGKIYMETKERPRFIIADKIVK